MGRACSSHREDEKRLQHLFGKSEGKRPFERARRDGRIILRLQRERV
jgi:hypothetical protein